MKKLIEKIFGPEGNRVGIRRRPQSRLSEVNGAPEVPAVDIERFRAAFVFNARLLRFIANSDSLSPQMTQDPDVNPDFFAQGQERVFGLIAQWKNDSLRFNEVAYKLEQLFEDTDISIVKSSAFRDKLLSMLELIETKDSLCDWCVDVHGNEGTEFRAAPDIFMAISDVLTHKPTLSSRIDIVEGSVRATLQNNVEEMFRKRGMPEIILQERELPRVMQAFEIESDMAINNYLEGLGTLRPLNFSIALINSANVFDIYFEQFFRNLRSDEASNIRRMRDFYNLIKVGKAVFSNEYIDRFDNYLRDDCTFVDRGVLINFYSSMALYYCLLETLYSVLCDIQKKP